MTLAVRVTGDPEVDAHHTVMGRGDRPRRGAQAGHCRCAVRMGIGQPSTRRFPGRGGGPGRPHSTFNAKLLRQEVHRRQHVDLTQDFLQAFVNHARASAQTNAPATGGTCTTSSRRSSRPPPSRAPRRDHARRNGAHEGAAMRASERRGSPMSRPERAAEEAASPADVAEAEPALGCSGGAQVPRVRRAGGTGALSGMTVPL